MTLAHDLVQRLQNSDIDWDAGFLGIRPRYVGGPARQLVKLHPAADVYLFIALNNPTKFAAAHVLLTKAYRWTTDNNTWNGLLVRMDRDGQVILNWNQMPELQSYWSNRLELQTVSLPTWPLLAIAGIPLGRRVHLLYRRARRRRLGQCIGCGYDIRDCKSNCPECGAEIVLDARRSLANPG